MALTQVILDGPMGKLFGKEWNLAVSTPSQALSMIDANKPGLTGWIRNNKAKYAKYRVTMIDRRGKKLTLSEDEYLLARDESPAIIRFTPVTEGRSATLRIVIGVVLVVVGLMTGNAYLTPMGLSLMIGGLVEMLSPRPKSKNNTNDDGTSYYFNGPVNTTAQGVPVPLVYGRCLVGSQAVSASVSIDQLMG